MKLKNKTYTEAKEKLEELIGQNDELKNSNVDFSDKTIGSLIQKLTWLYKVSPDKIESDFPRCGTDSILEKLGLARLYFGVVEYCGPICEMDYDAWICEITPKGQEFYQTYCKSDK